MTLQLQKDVLTHLKKGSANFNYNGQKSPSLTVYSTGEAVEKQALSQSAGGNVN